MSHRCWLWHSFGWWLSVAWVIGPCPRHPHLHLRLHQQWILNDGAAGLGQQVQVVLQVQVQVVVQGQVPALRLVGGQPHGGLPLSGTHGPSLLPSLGWAPLLAWTRWP